MRHINSETKGFDCQTSVRFFQPFACIVHTQGLGKGAGIIELKIFPILHIHGKNIDSLH